ncbi:Vibriobactin receptor [Nymphon striatum]|nr:Vibriobactin receptor [Nymphon striatum]
MDLSRSGGSATLFDIDQIEVIRGPQGTKFGANALAGIINTKAVEPSNEWKGKMEIGLGNYDKKSAGIAVGGPLIKDKLLGRFSLHSNKSDGYITNTFLDRDNTNNVDEVTARGHLKWFASDNVMVDLRYLHLDIDNGYDAFNFDNDRTTQSDEPGEDSQNTDAFSLNTVWDINDKITLETSASRSSSDTVYSYDDDWSFDGVFTNNYDTKNTAIYGQLDTQLNDKTKLITGLRVEKWKADYKDSNGNDIPVDETLYGGKLGLEYEVNDNHLTHATVSRGYKAGGVNPSSELQEDQLSFDTEFLWNFEVGVNSSLLDDKLNTRISAFYAKRKDQQTKNSTPLPDGENGTRFLDLTSNAAEGSNYGLEAELDWAINSKLTLKSSLGLLHAKFDEYETPDRDFSGRDQAHAPNYQYSVGAEYKINPQLTAGVTLEGKDGFYFSDSHDERADSYQVVNANLSYKRKNITTTLWGRNLLDEDYDTRGFFFGNNPGNGYTAEKYTQKGEPRVFGVNVSVDF